MHRRLTLALSTLALAACTTGAPSGSSDDASGAGTQASSAGTTSAALSDAPTAAAPQTSSVEGPCPYLSQDFMELTVGQRIGKIVVTTVTPPPGPLPRCEFQRGSGEPAATVDTLTIAAGQGLQKSLELVPGGNPVQAGEGGSVVVRKGEAKTELAAFKGTTLVYVSINQESSLEATEIAKSVLEQV